MSLRRKYKLDVFDLTCRQCMEYRVFSYKKFEAILKRNDLESESDEPARFDAPTPTNHENMRGSDYFSGIPIR